MSCSFDREIIQRYVDNTIDPLEFIFLKEHINYCNECRQEIELVQNLENQLYKFFDKESELGDLDLLITKLVSDCIDEVERNKKLKYALHKGMEISSNIIDNSTRFVGYIPGSKSIRKQASNAASATKGLFKSIVKKEVKRLIASVR